jgi:hypothetical protein
VKPPATPATAEELSARGAAASGTPA